MKKQTKVIGISAPRFGRVKVRIKGTAPLMIHRFSQKAQESLGSTEKMGDQPAKKRIAKARDFKREYEDAKHVSTEGWLGFCASAVRAAAVSACRLTGFTMTLAKLSLFVEADGLDREDGFPLIRVTKGTPHLSKMIARNKNTGGCATVIRPMWNPGWEAVLSIQFDGDQFSSNDVLNLITRVGLQVGIGCGRPDSRESVGLGFGTFRIDKIIQIEEPHPIAYK